MSKNFGSIPELNAGIKKSARKAERIKTIAGYSLFLILVLPAAMITLVFFWETHFICREYIPQTGAVGALVTR